MTWPLCLHTPRCTVSPGLHYPQLTRLRFSSLIRLAEYLEKMSELLVSFLVSTTVYSIHSYIDCIIQFDIVLSRRLSLVDRMTTTYKCLMSLVEIPSLTYRFLVCLVHTRYPAIPPTYADLTLATSLTYVSLSRCLPSHQQSASRRGQNLSLIHI